MKRTMTGIVLMFFLLPAFVLAASDPGNKDVIRFDVAERSSGTVVVSLIIQNDEPVTAMDIPLKFGNADDAITLDKVEFPAGGRVGDFDFKIAKIDNKAKTVLIGLVSSGYSMKPAMKEGDEAVALLHFTVSKDFTIDVDASKAPQHTPTLIENRDVAGGKEVIDFAPDFIKGQIIVIGKPGLNLPKAYALNGNYPNPFNPKTKISFALPKASKVTLDVYNILGQKVRTLINGDMDAGYQSVEWDGTDDNGVGISSGVYLYKLKAGDSFTKVNKMTFLK